jgi:hypothetical protein
VGVGEQFCESLSHFVSQSRFVSGLTKTKTSCPHIGGKRTEVTDSEKSAKRGVEKITYNLTVYRMS